MTSFELSINFFRKIQQFFMSDFLHSKYAKRRRICGMSRADKNPLFHQTVQNYFYKILVKLKLLLEMPHVASRPILETKQQKHLRRCHHELFVAINHLQLDLSLSKVPHKTSRFDFDFETQTF